jgi:Flp pilus assembly protein TadD
MAAEVAAKEPGNAAYVSTHAYALLSKGDIQGAREAMAALSDEQLRDPSVATYYGLVLAAAGETEKAREFLRRSAEAQLLPEEKALVTRAEKRLSESARE